MLEHSEQTVEYHRGVFCISTDKTRLNIDTIHVFLSQSSYWAKHVPRTVVEQSITHALCFGVYHVQEQKQVGFGRIITDYATFGYLSDVFILPAYRGHGLGKWLVQCMLEHPLLQGLRRWALATWDAHDLYRQVGFQSLSHPEIFMEIYHPDIYRQDGA